MYKIGIDCGSTTVKIVIVKENEIVFETYKRHNADIVLTILDILNEVNNKFGNIESTINFTGSAGFKIAESLKLEHTQEVIAATNAILEKHDNVDSCIELGGEDAKVIFLDGINPEQRMNGACAGGTGAFIDQMASLLDTDPTGINEYAKGYDKIYPIAARCGVFAKTDIQPLINQGVRKEDISASIYQAVVNQTITGLAQGKKIKGRVCFLGGPLTFSSELRKRFIETLELDENEVILPENSSVFMAYGAAISNESGKILSMEKLITELSDYNKNKSMTYKKVLDPLFKNEQERKDFFQKHSKNNVLIKEDELKSYKGKAFLGIDCGSTTSKVVLINEDKEIIYKYYSSNKGTPIDVVKSILNEIYAANKDINICGAVSTGYGEKLVENAFKLDRGMVETVCHYRASKHFMPNVDFIIDIGGQDMKCFKVTNGSISSIILNEACSSGCGSFIETFADALGEKIEDFANMGLDAKQPVDLGSKCTVFMNSSVKSAQKEGATKQDISAGLAYSVVKNSLYKVIRVNDVKKECGENIIVQGGTFYNNAVLRAFEKETKVNVVRPNIAGLMGAFGAALVAFDMNLEKSTIIDLDKLSKFTYKSTNINCGKCPNNCLMTVNSFDGEKFISGNRCEIGAGMKNRSKNPNLYAIKYDKLISYEKDVESAKGTIGIPLVLNMYENIPFFATFFNELGYNIKLSGRSSKKVYEYGQSTIPSDTVCYPAKLVHGHIELLKDMKLDYIFYPNMVFNVKEKNHVNNHFNCPVVAHYPELISLNVENLNNFLMPYVVFNKVSKKQHTEFKNPVFVDRVYQELGKLLKIKKSEIKKAYKLAIDEYLNYKEFVKEEGQKAIDYARKNDKELIVLAGRPYHIDPEINHGIDKLLASLDCVTVSEDAVSHLENYDNQKVLNQWSYHTRLYDAALWASKQEKTNLVQFVSFGCGLDAITTDEVREILEKSNKFYTQLKIDEISNLGAVNIRLRSLLENIK